jgi:HAD superfamily hydrolase (TIGR01509 family)
MQSTPRIDSDWLQGFTEFVGEREQLSSYQIVRNPMQETDVLSVQAIIFDLDGVIIDSEPLHAEALRRAGRALGFEVTPDMDERFRGITEAVEIDYLVAQHTHLGLTYDQVAAAKRTAYDGLFDQLTLVDGVDSFIRRCCTLGLPLGLATSAHAHNQQRAFIRFGLSPYFQAVVTGDDVVNSKPHPEPYLKAAQRLAVAPANCLVIEDSLNGVRSGKAAGCLVAGLTTTTLHADLLAAGADVVVDRYVELGRWLGWQSFNHDA